MNRKQFARTVQDAYKSQYGIDGEDSHVMGYPIVVYNVEEGRFYWQSNLTPVDPDVEVIVLAVQEGMFGSDDDTLAGDAIYEYVVDDKETWHEVRQKVLQEVAERIYAEVIGADHKPTADVIVGEIYDWLYEGDPDAFDIESLSAEYAEYAGY